MYDIITIGSATRDIFIRSDAFETHPDSHSPTGTDCCFPLGEKIEIKNLVFETGGGATNAAVTFARLGHRTAALTCVGDDPGARDIIDVLKREKVATGLLQSLKGEMTAYSAIILTGSGERTVLVYRGAAEKFDAERFPWGKMKAKWFYVSSIGGNLDIMAKILDHAEKHGIAVAWNPGSKELKQGAEKILPLVGRCAVFNLNVEEAMSLLGTSDRDIRKLLARLGPATKRTAIVTDGRAGAYAWDNGQIRHSGIVDVPRVNVTGAGDAFGSGVVAGLLKKDDLRYALAVGSSNSTGVVQQMGAKRGILKSYPTDAEIAEVPMETMD